MVWGLYDTWLWFVGLVGYISLQCNVELVVKQFEQLDGFRSWYLLQHFVGYGFKPFITKMDFEL
ncbi:DUF3289 family protein [Aliivibrio fischeri]|uniref:DUF3289 family protein n=1 Tax=Aliivibrio fischeri TaxID=668 RepID=UPI002E2BB99C|nr:DUF3289 family protein [Aliivibrio fischeri]